MVHLIISHVLLLCAISHIVCSLEALRPDEKVSVEIGSSSVELDCPYELGNEKNLVIKWYFNDKPSFVYQWIPQESPPTALGHLVGLLDLEHEVGYDEMSKHSSLLILNPTYELSGTYKCVISTFSSEAKSIRHLTVYAPANNLSITVEDSDDDVTVTCESHGAFPEPEMHLYKSVDGNFDSMLEQKPLCFSTFDERNSTYSVNVTQTFKHSKLDYSNKFLCSLTIPGTDYELELDTIFEPDPTTTSSTSTSTISPSFSVSVPAGSLMNRGQIFLVSFGVYLATISWYSS